LKSDKGSDFKNNTISLHAQVILWILVLTVYLPCKRCKTMLYMFKVHIQEIKTLTPSNTCAFKFGLDILWFYLFVIKV